MSPVTDGQCWWMELTEQPSYAALQDDLTVDVCVVGGGITGILTAWELSRRGFSVALLESKRVASAVTGYTTSKLTSQHGLKYSGLEDRHGAQAAAWYGAATQRALERIVQLSAEQQIEADIERRDAYVYAGLPETNEVVRAEVAAAVRAGLPASYTDDVPLPYATHGAVVFSQQAQFHPRKLLIGLVRRLAEQGIAVHEQTEVTQIDAVGTLALVHTEGGAVVRADHVVLATLLPSPLGGDLRAHLYCHQGYAVAVPVPVDPTPTGVFINADRPMRSLRSIPSPEGRLLQVGGSAWVDDPNSGRTPWDDLEAWAHQHFDTEGSSPTLWRWTTQDYSSSDGVPLIGPLERGGRIHVAAGFGGWGLTTAGVAAELITGLVRGEPQDWHELFAPTRQLPVVDSRIISSHRRGLGVAPDRALAELAPGCAAVLEVDGEEVAAYREPDGSLHRVSAACTHLGGIVLWDGTDQQWQCPCHGSRFAPDGSVTKGPAREPLPPR